jgi:hypothetical protein
MSVLDTLTRMGGCAGGVFVYGAAKTTCFAANIQRKKRKLNLDVINRMTQLFPNLDLSKIRFSINCSLPGNWFAEGSPYKAITFGDRIFFDDSDIQKTESGLKLLMHELIHVDQCRRLGGETRFACEYGKGYLSGGGYLNNPMEIEARNFVLNHPVPAKTYVAKLEWWYEQFYSGTKRTRYLYPSQHGKKIKLKHNDAMKSLKFYAKPGWQLEIYDNSDCKKSDDWGRIKFPNNPGTKVVELPKIGRNGENEVVPPGCYKFYYKNGLPGQVSAIKHFGPTS